ncbi:hypothetical protein ACQP1G_21755 [Nocardia sp. CA-107356]|uniref:hypothetical protein n=1 Tax=Nocardia sp. CA-107356 TaxID=3239972 RepID=UPI003D8D840C
MQGDLEAGEILVREGHALAAALADSTVDVVVAYADAFFAYCSGQISRAAALLEDSVVEFHRQDRLALEVEALTMLGLCHAMLESAERAGEYYRRVLGITESRGESVSRSYALWALGVLKWQSG